VFASVYAVPKMSDGADDRSPRGLLDANSNHDGRWWSLSLVGGQSTAPLDGDRRSTARCCTAAAFRAPKIIERVQMVRSGSVKLWIRSLSGANEPIDATCAPSYALPNEVAR
jgi:hypothetical protein